MGKKYLKIRRGVPKKVVSALIALAMLLSLLPFNIFAEDKWEILPPKDTEYIYYHNASTSNPSLGQTLEPPGDIFLQRFGLVGHEAEAVTIHEYHLTNLANDFSLWTYCSDFATRAQVYYPDTPNLDRLYRRIPIESVL
ncbi:MAG: hypothetical protein FWF83_06810, partial [Clostridiales bacterium]|nr:hypothetical protein [Clostridiales bacterium]